MSIIPDSYDYQISKIGENVITKTSKVEIHLFYNFEEEEEEREEREEVVDKDIEGLQYSE